MDEDANIKNFIIKIEIKSKDNLKENMESKNTEDIDDLGKDEISRPIWEQLERQIDDKIKKQTQSNIESTETD